MKLSYIFVGFSMVAATAAFAHSGVKNAAVKARMDAMSSIGAEMKTLGEMTKGVSAFDVSIARAAAASIADHAAETPDLFRAEEDDPKSEATPAIWADFDDFTAKAVALENAARGASSTISSVDDLAPAMKALGETCKACHADYRQKR